MSEVFRAVAPWATASWVVSGIIYASMYWWGFGITTPPFVSFDVAGAYGIVPVISSAPVLAGYMLGSAMSWRWFPHGGGSGTAFANRTRPYLPVFYIILYFFMYWLMSYEKLFVVVIGMMPLAIAPIHLLLMDGGALKEVASAQLRGVLLDVIVMMPLCAALLGIHHGAAIRDGQNTLLPRRPVLQEVESGNRYVGHLGDYIVFFALDKERVVLQRVDAVDTVELVAAKEVEYAEPEVD